jgi:hypothetical protein
MKIDELVKTKKNSDENPDLPKYVWILKKKNLPIKQS